MSDQFPTDSSTPTLTASGLRRLEYIDGLRALAALWVVLHHALETTGRLAIMRIPVVGPIFSTLLWGQFAVMVFLVLSGFCLYYPLTRKNPSLPNLGVSLTEYIKRRARRIVPPYFAAMALCLLLILLVPGMGYSTDRSFWNTVFPINGKVIASHLLLIHNVIPGHSDKIDYPMWSIALEWQLYLFFPLLVLALARLKPSMLLILALFVTTASRVNMHGMPQLIQFILRNGPTAYIAVFVTGMLAARTVVSGKLPAPKWALGILGLVCAGVVRASAGNGLVHDLATMVGTYCLLVLAVDHESLLSRVLSAPKLVKIGVYSYSLYLVHAPLLHLLWLALKPFGLSPDAQFALITMFGTPLILAVAYGFHVLFERPTMRAPAKQSATPLA